MPYNVPATSKTPALIIYLLDISRSMNETVDGLRKIDVVLAALKKAVSTMVRRSTKGTAIAPRYRIAIYGYHQEVVDFLGGIRTVAELVERGIPQPNLNYGTQTARGFAAVEKLLTLELPHIQDHPAPLVCHLTDGIYGGADPEPIVTRIRSMAIPDGNVLIENVFYSKSVLAEPISNPQTWSGVKSIDQIQVDKTYARKLFAMSSVIPDSYLTTLREFGYRLQPGARMLFPAHKPELLQLAFAMSAATPVTY
jgi:hypothetical protein